MNKVPMVHEDKKKKRKKKTNAFIRLRVAKQLYNWMVSLIVAQGK